jgi:hypothetical protein
MNVELNAGVISWTAKKVIGGMVKIILKTTSKKLIEIQVEKLVNYLRKNPQHIEYTINKVHQYVQKHPQYSQRANYLLTHISKVFSPKNEK